MRVRQLFEAYESAFLCWGNLPNYGLYGNYSPDRHDEERVYAGFRAFLRSDARHFMVGTKLMAPLSCCVWLTNSLPGQPLV